MKNNNNNNSNFLLVFLCLWVVSAPAVHVVDAFAPPPAIIRQTICHHHHHLPSVGSSSSSTRSAVTVSSSSITTTTTTTTTLHAAAQQQQQQKTAVIAGATGYIGKSVVREAVRQGYQTFALVRDMKQARNNPKLMQEFFQGAELVECDVTDAAAVTKALQDIGNTSNSNSNNNTNKNNNKIDAVVSCLASRSGIKKDAYLIDYQATLHCLQAAQACQAGHFVLLSAFCVKNPWLQFQQAKLKFEAALQEQTDVTWSIVRPTAFFKSVSGQLEVVQSGAPFVAFGRDGSITKCNPIAESDLAKYLMDCVTDKSRHNRIINLGGPDEPLTMKKQGEMLFAATGREPKFIFAPVWIFDVVINTLQFLADITGSEQLENAAETGRIGKYYAVEDMLTTDPDEKYGTITLQEHYNRIAVEGQEYDPYTTMFSKYRVKDDADTAAAGADTTAAAATNKKEEQTTTAASS